MVHPPPSGQSTCHFPMERLETHKMAWETVCIQAASLVWRQSLVPQRFLRSTEAGSGPFGEPPRLQETRDTQRPLETKGESTYHWHHHKGRVSLSLTHTQEMLSSIYFTSHTSAQPATLTKTRRLFRWAGNEERLAKLLCWTPRIPAGTWREAGF